MAGYSGVNQLTANDPDILDAQLTTWSELESFSTAELYRVHGALITYRYNYYHQKQHYNTGSFLSFNLLGAVTQNETNSSRLSSLA